MPHVCCSDREYPRLGQMIVDYENPLKKMMEEFVPHGKVEKLTLWHWFILVNWNKHVLLIRHCYHCAGWHFSALFIIKSHFCPLHYYFPLFILSLNRSYFLPFPMDLSLAVPVRCIDQSPDGLSQEKSLGWPVEECPAAFTYLGTIHHAQSCSVRHS